VRENLLNRIYQLTVTNCNLHDVMLWKLPLNLVKTMKTYYYYKENIDKYRKINVKIIYDEICRQREKSESVTFSSNFLNRLKTK